MRWVWGAAAVRCWAKALVEMPVAAQVCAGEEVASIGMSKALAINC